MNEPTILKTFFRRGDYVLLKKRVDEINAKTGKNLPSSYGHLRKVVSGKHWNEQVLLLALEVAQRRKSLKDKIAALAQ
jgi:hypothetical protein